LGELLVQYELLRCGIDSAPMTTDAGVDLVAYSGVKGLSITLQVKTNMAPKPGGGRGALAVDWWVSEDCPAELYAFADLSSRRIWILTKQELASAAQQRSSVPPYVDEVYGLVTTLWAASHGVRPSPDERRRRSSAKISIDLWFNVEVADLHRVIDFLPRLHWQGYC
jgi:hypothetical protein